LQGAIDATKPQTFYPGAAPAAPPSSLQGTQGIVTIPRSVRFNQSSISFINV